MANVAASVKARLNNQAKEIEKPAQYLYLHYGIERFLYRLGQSPYVEQFILKGGLAFLALDTSFPRATTDIDFLGFGLNDVSTIKTVIGEVCQTPIEEDDGLTFDLTTLTADVIREKDRYTGVRVKLIAYLERSRIPLQIDCGFGDTVHPKAEFQSYPVLLSDQPAPCIQTYPPETILAEKIHTMIDLDIASSRVKDYYDIWYLSETLTLSGTTMCDAIRQTFARRETPVPSNLRESFFEELVTINEVRWRGFQKKFRIPEELPAILGRVEEFVSPLFTAVASNQTLAGQWVAGAGWVAIKGEGELADDEPL